MARHHAEPRLHGRRHGHAGCRARPLLDGRQRRQRLPDAPSPVPERHPSLFGGPRDPRHESARGPGRGRVGGPRRCGRPAHRVGPRYVLPARRRLRGGGARHVGDPGFIQGLGLRAERGRVLEPADFAPGDPTAVMISHHLWASHFGGDPDVVGRTLKAYVSDRPDEPETLTVVGVLPADFWHVNI
ncbi:MAG: hypothetical protein GEV06_18025 [Luteitalea sp.]|nr:hypothetical protein [Luteitalea sp.]